jgi:REP element-mobilizing transposase RayT
VWATWDRLPLVTKEFRDTIYRCLITQVAKRDCQTVAVGGMPDHVHMLIRLPTSVSIGEIVKFAKGGSSHLMTQEINPHRFFKWQKHYGAFTIARNDVARFRAYVHNQEQHHRCGTIDPILERTEESRT